MKKVLFFGLIIGGLFLLVSLFFLGDLNLCEGGLKELPSSIEKIAANPQFYLNVTKDAKCTDKLTNALIDGATVSNSKKRYVCALFKIARTSDTYWGETFAEVILPELFLKNPVDCIRCVQIDKNDSYALEEGIGLLVQSKRISTQQLNEIIHNLEKEKSFNEKERGKVQKLKLAIMSTLGRSYLEEKTN